MLGILRPKEKDRVVKVSSELGGEKEWCLVLSNTTGENAGTVGDMTRTLLGLQAGQQNLH